MKRKILPFFLAACLIFSLTGCMGRNGGTSVSSTATPAPKATATAKASPTPAASASPESSNLTGEEVMDAEGSSAANREDIGVFTPFREALYSVYGDRYAPDTRLTDEQIRTELGLDDSLYEEVFAENVSGGISPDTFIAVKAKAGKAEEVKKKLEAYKDKMSKDTAWSKYTDKIGAAQVYAEGDYVFFLLTAGTETTENSTGMAETLGKDVQKGIDAIKEALGMM